MAATINDIRSGLERFLADRTGASVRINSARHLTGGASRESWAIDLEVASGPEAGSHALVLRLDMGGVIQDEALTREQEYQVLEAACRAGVRAPRPRWLCIDPAVLGAPFFLMDRLPGESVGRRVVREPGLAEARKRLPEQMAAQLARIHALDWKRSGLSFLPCPVSGASAAETALAHADRQLQRFGEPHPALELAMRWLRMNLPSPSELVLVHGDFRVGNLLVDPSGLTGVLDWEFTHVGDAAEDLGWPCVRSWRFGQDQLRVGGVGEREEFLTVYEAASGRRVDRRAVSYWEILGNFRWAVGCLAQARRHLEGQTQSLELASLGRKAAEVELELLDLLEQECSPP